MAKQDLQALVNRIEERIYKDAETFRKLVSDFKTHVITVNKKEIIEQVEQEMFLRENPGGEGTVKVTEATKRIIEDGVDKLVTTLYNHFNPTNYNSTAQRWTIASELTGTKDDFTFVLAAKPNKTANVFNTFKRKKQVAQRPLLNALNKKIRQLNKGNKNLQRDTIRARDGFLDIGHGKGFAVNTQRSDIVEDMITTYSRDLDNAIVSSFLDDLLGDIRLTIVKGDKGPTRDIVGVGIESKTLNRASNSAEKKEVANLNQMLNDAVSQFAEEFPNLEGSDSSVQKRKKIILKGLDKTLKSKNITTDFEDLTLKPSFKGTVKSKARKRKTEIVKTSDKVKRKRRARKAKKAKGISTQPLVLIGLLNKELPATVRKNMKEPNLVNRSGRFAQSVKITDITQTPQGYPSIGYTYQQSPYRVFEDGSGIPPWSNGERDPRDLIDRSIREIAIKFAIGRFYTRRV